MTIEDFIKENQAQIDYWICKETGSNDPLDNQERELWVMNDQALYNWAKDEGVDMD